MQLPSAAIRSAVFKAAVENTAKKGASQLCDPDNNGCSQVIKHCHEQIHCSQISAIYWRSNRWRSELLVCQKSS